MKAFHWIENRRSAGFLLVAWCLVIFLFSSIPGNKYPEVPFPMIDKFVHVMLYCPIGLLACLYFQHRFQSPYRISISFGIVYGFTDEFHQLFVPRRTFSFEDIIADTIGVSVGLFMFYLLSNYLFSWSDRNLQKLDGDVSEVL